MSSGASRRIAALYDIHGNLPALEAVLEEVEAAGVDLIVAGGDVVMGPMPRETLARLLDLDTPGAVHPGQLRARDAGSAGRSAGDGA